MADKQDDSEQGEQDAEPQAPEQSAPQQAPGQLYNDAGLAGILTNLSSRRAANARAVGDMGKAQQWSDVFGVASGLFRQLRPAIQRPKTAREAGENFQMRQEGLQQIAGAVGNEVALPVKQQQLQQQFDQGELQNTVAALKARGAARQQMTDATDPRVKAAVASGAIPAEQAGSVPLGEVGDVASQYQTGLQSQELQRKAADMPPGPAKDAVLKRLGLPAGAALTPEQEEQVGKATGAEAARASAAQTWHQLGTAVSPWERQLVFETAKRAGFDEGMAAHFATTMPREDVDKVLAPLANQMMARSLEIQKQFRDQGPIRNGLSQEVNALKSAIDLAGKTPQNVPGMGPSKLNDAGQLVRSLTGNLSQSDRTMLALLDQWAAGANQAGSARGNSPVQLKQRLEQLGVPQPYATSQTFWQGSKAILQHLRTVVTSESLGYPEDMLKSGGMPTPDDIDEMLAKVEKGLAAANGEGSINQPGQQQDQQGTKEYNGKTYKWVP